MDNYHVIELVGEGSFGKVYKGRRKYTGQVCLNPIEACIELILLVVIVSIVVMKMLFLIADCCHEIYS